MLENVPEHHRVERLVRHRLERLRSLQPRDPRFLDPPAREFGVPFESRRLPSEVPQDAEEISATAADLQLSSTRHPTGHPVMAPKHAAPETPGGQSPAGGEAIRGAVPEPARENVAFHPILPAVEDGACRIEDPKALAGVLGVRTVVGAVQLLERRTARTWVQEDEAAGRAADEREGLVRGLLVIANGRPGQHPLIPAQRTVG